MVCTLGPIREVQAQVLAIHTGSQKIVTLENIAYSHVAYYPSELMTGARKLLSEPDTRLWENL